MRTKLEFIGETISDNSNGRQYGCVIQRVKVFGGWIVYCTVRTQEGIAITSDFVQDKEHLWTISPRTVTEPPKEPAEIDAMML
jgi:hypothetical protein